MSLLGRKITAFLKRVSDLPDRPSPTYSAAEIKAQFDSSPEELRLAVNGLIDDLTAVVPGASGADQVGSAPISGVTGTTLHAQLVALKTLLDVAANQNAFSTIAVSGQSNVVADAVTDTLTLVGGTGIAITTNAGSDTVTITATGSATPGAHAATHITGGTDVIPNAVAGGNAGLLSGADKAKLDSALTTTGGQTVNGQFTASGLQAIGLGDLNLDDTSSANPTVYFRIDGIVRALLFHDRASGKLALRINNPDGTTNQTINFAYMDSVTPTAMMQFPSNMNWATNKRAAIDLNFSDIVGACAILFDQEASSIYRGFLWPKTGAAVGSTTASDYTNMRVDGAGVGWIGTDAIWTDGNNVESKTSTGYQKLQSGIIIQWGIAPAVASGGSIQVPFPVAFPTACSSVTAISDGSGYCNTYGVSRLQAGFIQNGGNTPGIRWMAIGY